jgi:hypothetical protein
VRPARRPRPPQPARTSQRRRRESPATALTLPARVTVAVPAQPARIQIPRSRVVPPLAPAESPQLSTAMALVLAQRSRISHAMVSHVPAAARAPYRAQTVVQLAAWMATSAWVETHVLPQLSLVGARLVRLRTTAFAARRSRTAPMQRRHGPILVSHIQLVQRRAIAIGRPSTVAARRIVHQGSTAA